MAETPDPTTSLSARYLSRRQFLRLSLFSGGGAALACGPYSRWVEPFWTEFHEFPVALAGLPAAFAGFRIAHLTDLHAGPDVPQDYLLRVMRRVNALKPDLVAVTGDLVMGGSAYVARAVEALARLDAPTLVSLGNHDYGVSRSQGTTGIAGLADELQHGLEQVGCTVLRNRATTLCRGDARLWVVGLEDIWSGRFDPPTAFKGVPGDQPVIALSHNPDTMPALAPHAPALTLAGHTHGGQVRVPFFGAPILPVQNREFDQGLFALPYGQLYVGRGVGFLIQARFNCRPEVAVARLEKA